MRFENVSGRFENSKIPATPGIFAWSHKKKIFMSCESKVGYLREKVQLAVIHREVRPSNVLLFEDFKAEIADLNLSNQVPDMAAYLHSTRVLGTFGYHALEYAITGQWWLQFWSSSLRASYWEETRWSYHATWTAGSCYMGYTKTEWRQS